MQTGLDTVSEQLLYTINRESTTDIIMLPAPCSSRELLWGAKSRPESVYVVPDVDDINGQDIATEMLPERKVYL